MASLPVPFLETVAKQYSLTEYQTEAFVARFSNTDKTDWLIALYLNIGRTLYSSRMTAVYKKFGLTGKTPGKAQKLFLQLFELYQKTQSPSDQVATDVVESLASDIRKKIEGYIHDKCGSMRVLDMDYPIEIDDIYTEVQILDQVTSRRYLQISDLITEFNPEMDELLSVKEGSQRKTRLSGVDLVQDKPRLMIFGRPGAGKTTFLKHIALRCQKQDILPDFVPIFVSLKEFSDNDKRTSIIDYVQTSLSQYKEDIRPENKIDMERLNKLLEYSKIVFLLDGLDEVSGQVFNHVVEQIKALVNQFRGSRFIITCRIAAHDFAFDGFTEVEISDFNNKQIRTFADNWFTVREDKTKIEKFIQQLEADKRIYALAKNPLLLTLLCLVFGDSSGFPLNRSELYEEGLYVLLKKWDARRNIERAVAYKKLSRQRKEDLLSHLAYLTFENNEYFFKRRKIEYEIENYIRNLPTIKGSPESLEINSRAILNSIESQHGLLTERARGIYSFSHLTFHEYFTSRKIVNTLDPSAQEEILKKLVSHITEKRWREVFLLVVGMLSNAGYILKLMKLEVDNLFCDDRKLQDFLRWINIKASSVNYAEQSPMQAAMTRDFYFTLSILKVDDGSVKQQLEIINRKIKSIRRQRKLESHKNSNLALDSELMLALHQSLSLIQNISLLSSLASVRSSESAENTHKILSNILSRCISRMVNTQFRYALQELYDEISSSTSGFYLWWTANGIRWTQQLRSALIRYRNIGHNWQFTSKELELLNQYYDANRLLMTVLNSECYVNEEVRQEIQTNLLLPVSQRQSDVAAVTNLNSLQ